MGSLGHRLLILANLVLLVSEIACVDLFNNPNFPCGIKFDSNEKAWTNQGGTIVARALNSGSNDAQRVQNLGRTAEYVRRAQKHHQDARPPMNHTGLNVRSSAKNAPHAKNEAELPNKLTGDKNDLKVKTRIIGGVHGSIKEFPWIVSVQLKHGSHICGGSILTDQYILTASHCVADPSTNQLLERQYQIGIGSSVWREGHTYEVVKVIKHDGFAFETFENDLAIMKVKPRIQMRKGVTVPICLPPSNYQVTGSGTIAGWGKVNNQLSITSSSLMRADIEILDPSACKNVYDNYNDQKMICAGTLNGAKDSCNGDSGGPLQAVLPDGRVYVLGSVSFGDTICGKQNSPGVYTRQSAYLDWVRDTIEMMSKEAD